MVDLPLVGTGRTAEVYDLGEGRVVKLLLPGFDPAMLESEGRKTRAAHEAGLDVPGAHGAITVGGRTGFVFDRVEGVLMLDEMRERPLRAFRWSEVLARVHAGLHTGRSSDLPPVKEKLAEQIDRAEPLGARLRRVARDRLLTLPEGDRVLHGDFHPGNVVVTDAGPIVIDWLDASRGDPAADIARTAWLLSGTTIDPGTPNLRLITLLLAVFRRRYLRAYGRVAPLDASSLRAWRLPVLAGRLSEGIEHEERALLAAVRSLAD